MNIPAKNYVTKEEFCKLYNISKKTVRKLLLSGKITFEKSSIGNRYSRKCA